MGLSTGGIIGCTYVCGCSQRTDIDEKEFCDNPKHKEYSCGCYNIGGNSKHCIKHALFYLLCGLTALAVVVLVGAGIMST